MTPSNRNGNSEVRRLIYFVLSLPFVFAAVILVYNLLATRP
jgi:hypothetical protein